MTLDHIKAIFNPYPTSPFITIEAEKLQAIKKFAYIFKQNIDPQKSSHKDTSHTRMDITNNNPPKTTASQRVKIPSNLPTPAPVPRKSPKQHIPTRIVAYEEY